MKLSSLLISGLPVLASASLIDRKACLADSCLRALTVTDSSLRTSRPVMAASDCSKLMIQTSTVTIAPTATLYQTLSTTTSTTSTTFITGTSTATLVIPTTKVTRVLQPAVQKRDVLPSYLSMCVSVERLSSACSCIGITAATTTTTTTLPTLSLTITTSTTSTDTLVTTSAITQVTSTTTSTTVISTSTLAPVSGGTCGMKGYGYTDHRYLINPYGLTVESAAVCQATCLADPNCQSFQTATSYRLCYMYTKPVSLSGYASSAAVLNFYDITCTNIAP